jgi:hypothetical protein
MGIKSFLTPDFIEREINGQPLRFYAASVAMVLQLRAVAKPILSAIAALASDSFKKSSQETVRDGKGGERQFVTVEPSAITLEAYKVVADRRQKAIVELVESLMRPENLDIFARLAADSLREEYARPVAADALAVFKDVDVPTAAKIVQGIVEANASVFAPFVGKIPGFVKEFVDGSMPTGSVEPRLLEPVPSEMS